MMRQGANSESAMRFTFAISAVAADLVSMYATYATQPLE